MEQMEQKEEEQKEEEEEEEEEMEEMEQERKEEWRTRAQDRSRRGESFPCRTARRTARHCRRPPCRRRHHERRRRPSKGRRGTPGGTSFRKAATRAGPMGASRASRGELKAFKGREEVEGLSTR